MGLNDDKGSRRRGLSIGRDLIDGYEPDQMRVRDRNPIKPRTPAEVHRECDFYRRRAYTVWGFPKLARHFADEFCRSAIKSEHLSSMIRHRAMPLKKSDAPMGAALARYDLCLTAHRDRQGERAERCDLRLTKGLEIIVEKTRVMGGDLG